MEENRLVLNQIESNELLQVSQIIKEYLNYLEKIKEQVLKDEKNEGTIIKKIEAEKEVLSVLPKNNIKNKNSYLTKISELETEYKTLYEATQKEITKRIDEILKIEVNPEISSLEKSLEEKEELFYLWNPYSTSYEILGLDYLYQLRHFYKVNLDVVNEYILKIIKIFNKVGITLTSDDFKYTKFTELYMTVFFQNQDNLACEMIENCFEDLYWKCPNLIKHLELSLKYLYYKNKKTFDSYVIEQRKTPFSYDLYIEEMRKLDTLKRNDIALLIKDFTDKKRNIRDFTREKIEKLEHDRILDENDNNVLDDIQKLIFTLEEYQNRNTLSFILEDMKNKIAEKEKNKDASKTIKKTIASKEKALKKLHHKPFKLFGKTKTENINYPQIEALIKELSEAYEELEKSEFKARIFKNLNSNSSEYEALTLAYSSYTYYVELIKTKLSDNDFEKIAKTLKKLLLSPYNTIIINRPIMSEENIKLVIKDKYKLMNVKITEEELEEDTLPNVIHNLDMILMEKVIVASAYTLGDLIFLCDALDIRQKKLEIAKKVCYTESGEGK